MQIKKISNEEMQLCCIYNDKGRAVGVKDEAVWGFSISFKYTYRM